LYSHLARVRAALAHASVVDGGAGAQLVRRSGGYLLDVDPQQVDLHRFHQLTERARTAGNDIGQRVVWLRTALGLWRGQALSGLSGPWVERMRQAWRQRYLDALVAWSDAEIAAGNAAAVVDKVADQVAEHPLMESLAAAFMLALYACGRGAEALDFYEATRRRLVDELGADPGPQLQDLHRTILRTDLGPSVSAPLTSIDSATMPAQLPRDVYGFAGRAGELDRLDELLAAGGTQVPTVVISALSGTAGVGKTALAVHFAHRVATRFPDGQLYTDLRGFSPTGAARRPAEVIRGFLEALGVAAQKIPADQDAQAALYRSRLAGKRMLILLDNARDADQVRPLLPASPTCLVLVTSRNQLTGLTVQGARPLIVDLLTVEEARQLLAARLGEPRLAAEPHAVDEIIESCSRLPLALSIVAARAAEHATFPLATFAAELRHAGGRLDVLSSDDAHTDVRAVFSCSYQAVTPDAARLFRLLGLHPGPDLSGPAAASLAALSLPHVRILLAELARANLIVEHAPGRYTFHDLLRAYANGLAHQIDPDAQRHAAIHRLLDHYLHTAHAADQLLYPTRAPLALAEPQPGVTPERLVDQQQALAWFATEHAGLLAAVDHAATNGLDTHIWQLAWTMWPFLGRRGHWHDQVAIGHAAVAAAGRLAQPPALVNAHRILASAYLALERLDDAHNQLQDALDLNIQMGDRAGQAHIQYTLATVRERQGRYDEALDHARRALDLYRAADHRIGQARGLNTVGWYQGLLGDHQQALTHCQQAQALFEELGDHDGQAATWDSLGYNHRHLGHHAEALTCYQQALTLYRNLGDRYNEATILNHLGDSHQAADSHEPARDAWQQALTILTDLDHPDAETVRSKLQDLGRQDADS
jgi:tetratricopeptide (TPR) repeat protein